MSRKSTTEQLKEILQDSETLFEGAGERLELLREKVARMEAEGKLLKGEYSLPPIDTIGRRLYSNMAAARSPLEH